MKHIKDYLAQAEESHLKRQLRDMTPLSARECIVNGKKVLNFSSNNYLALADHPLLRKRANEFTDKYGVGSTASRLVCGTYDAFSEVEKRIAEWKKAEAALVFGSGYMANLGVISALADRKSIIFADKLNHASLNAGCQLSQAKFIRYKHDDISSATSPNITDHMKKMVVSDTVFSMDGNIADVSSLRRFANEIDAILYLDDAHASGVFGEQGEGLATPENEREIAMGTFSKAMGGYGAYVACSNTMREFLINRCGSFIYTTAPPPSVFGAIDASVELVQTSEYAEKRHNLMENRDFLDRELRGMGFDTGNSGTPVIPVIIGDSGSVMKISNVLVDNGILAVAIRPPTVPKGTARIRLSLNAAHTREDISLLLDNMDKAKKLL